MIEIYHNMIAVNLFVLIVWFKTDALIEYAKLIRVGKWIYVDDFEKKRAEDFELTYLTYLRQHRNCFFTRLITCPICVTSWMFLITLISENPIPNFSLNVTITLALYYLFSKLMR